MTSQAKATDFGRIAYERHAAFMNFSHPRLGMRTAAWDELGDKSQDEWRKVAKTVIEAFIEALAHVY